MQYYLLFVVIPVVIISIIRSARRSAQAAKHAADDFSGSMPEPVVRKEPRANVSEPAAQQKMHFNKPAEGKSQLEIDMNRTKIQAEEHKNIRLEETRRELKEMDLKHLRTAVVMSEILDRPVSLRRRGYPR